MIQLGDMILIEQPPAKLLRALAVIANGLHQGFELLPHLEPGKSKDSCVLCSLTVRDFLREIGFERARVVPVATAMWATENDKPLHSLGIGAPGDDQRREGRWRGHMVVVAAGYLIDTTLYTARRPAWPDLAGMMALPVHRGNGQRWEGLDLVAAAGIEDDERPEYQFTVSWFANPTNTSWHQAPDCDRARRLPVVADLWRQWGMWSG